jgi:hypothetical protein
MHSFYVLHEKKIYIYKNYVKVYVTECKIYLQKNPIPAFNNEKKHSALHATRITSSTFSTNITGTLKTNSDIQE